MSDIATVSYYTYTVTDKKTGKERQCSKKYIKTKQPKLQLKREITKELMTLSFDDLQLISKLISSIQKNEN